MYSAFRNPFTQMKEIVDFEEKLAAAKN